MNQSLDILDTHVQELIKDCFEMKYGVDKSESREEFRIIRSYVLRLVAGVAHEAAARAVKEEL
ncbi:hypothetical protein D3C76_102050 [compost metagenome]